MINILMKNFLFTPGSNTAPLGIYKISIFWLNIEIGVQCVLFHNSKRRKFTISNILGVPT